MCSTPRRRSIPIICLAALLVIGCGSDTVGDLAKGPTPGAPFANGPLASRGDGGASATHCAPGQTRACYTGPAHARGVGICREGVETCVRQGEFGGWGPCLGSVSPSDTPTGTCECTPGMLDGGSGAVVPDNTPKLCDGVHTECDCGKLGGAVVDIGEPCRICRLEASACPAGWDGYKNWRTTTDGVGCGAVEYLANTGAGGAQERCPAQVPAVKTPTRSYLLSCERGANYCCGTPPSGITAPAGRAWSPHAAAVVSFTQGYNPCGCACGPEQCTTTTATCEAPTTQIGCR